MSCEHGGNRVPRQYAHAFASRAAQRMLSTHRAFDLGALPLARLLALRLEAPLIHSSITRLLVDLNRSIGHRGLFSRFTRNLDAQSKARILADIYAPHRQRVIETIDAQLSGGRPVLHIAVHSFTPRLGPHLRSADIGLLYDPQRRPERAFCDAWKRGLLRLDPALRVRRNYPYRGVDDGLTTFLRRRYPANRYAGIEIEVNQQWLEGLERSRITGLILASLETLLKRATATPA